MLAVLYARRDGVHTSAQAGGFIVSITEETLYA